MPRHGVLAQLPAVNIGNTAGEDHDRVYDGPNHDGHQQRKAKQAEEAEEECEQPQAQLHSANGRRADVEAAYAEEAKE